MALQADVEDIYPLSPLQQGVLFHSVRNPHAGDYVVQFSAQLSPAISPAVFRQAWEMMVARHAVLRTLFVSDAPERPLQVVVRSAELPWIELDWRNTSDEEWRKRLRAAIAADRRRGYELTNPPLLRVAVMRLTANRWWVLVSCHHLLLDGWSMEQLLQELGWCCEALVHGRLPDLPDRPPYRDFITWLDRQDVTAGQAFWRTILAGVEPMPALVVHREAADRAEKSYGKLSIRLTPDEHGALADFTRRCRITVNTAIQGAVAILLSRYTGATDVVLGATVAGRPPDLVGVDAMLGLFLNTIPVRVSVAEHPRLDEWLAALQVQQARAREFSYCQLAEIQQAASPGAALFGTILDVKSFPLLRQRGKSDFPLFAGNVDSFEQGGYSMTFDASFEPELVIDCEYDQSRFSATTATWLLSHLRNLLNRMPGNARSALADLDLLGVDERRVIAAWSNGPIQCASALVFPHDFEAHATAAPLAPAVITDSGRLDYATVNERANQVAWELRDLGVGPERRVGVCVERSAALVTAVLAILKAGGVYVPLDPTHPPERLAHCAATVGLDAMIVTDSTAALAPVAARAILHLDRDKERIETRPRVNPPAVADSRNLAYITFTSGSTGAPKAAMTDIGGMLNHLYAMIDALALGPVDVVGQTAPIGFDISVWQLLAPLAVGGAVRIFADEVVFAPTALARGIQRDAVTVVQIVPALLRLLLDDAMRTGAGLADTLRWMVVTGDALADGLVARWHAVYPDIPVLNAYGCAECADDITLAAIAKDAPRQGQSAPIGMPIGNSQLYVLDHGMRLVPAGVAGEIYIGGCAVGRGYAGDTARTAAAFVPNPFAEQPGERLYRTGDLGWWRDDGLLGFLGRVDAQTKVNGARVDTDDVECVIAEHRDVRQAVVLVVGEADARRLVAFVVPAEPASGADLAERIRVHLRARIPRFMVPSTVTMVDGLPLTANGKIDRRQLRQRAETAVATRRRGRQLTPAEEAMGAIWAQILRLDRVDPEDDFFELGGHSLLAMRLVAAASQEFDCAIPLETLFDAPQLGDFSHRVESMKTARAGGRPRLEPAPHGATAPASSAQRRIWMLVTSYPHYGLYTMPMAIRISGALDQTALSQALADVVARHETLRTRVRVDEGGVLIQCIDDPPLSFALPVVDLARYGSDVEAIARQVAGEEAARGFNPIEEHGLRAAVMRLAEDQHILLITLNHLVADDASIGILRRDLTQAYEARCAGLPSPLVPLRVQFADYVCWVDQWLASEDGKRAEAYWRRRLAQPWTRLELPTSRARGTSPGHRFRRVRGRLAGRADRCLRDFARARGVSLFTVVLSVYKLFLARLSGTTDIAVATMVSTRDGADLSEVVGPLLTTHVLRTELRDASNLAEVLPRVQRTVVEALASRDLPIDRVLAAATGSAPDPASRPIATLLLFQHVAEEAWTMGDLRATPFALPRKSGDELEFSSYEVICEVENRQDALDLVLRYDADLYDDELAGRMIREFEGLLASYATEAVERW